jgi:hypothetical protein
VSALFLDIVDDYRHEKWQVVRHVVGASRSQSPFAPEVALQASLRGRRNGRNEQAAVVDMLAYLLVPRVAVAQFVLVEPNLNASGTQGITMRCTTAASCEA